MFSQLTGRYDSHHRFVDGSEESDTIELQLNLQSPDELWLCCLIRFPYGMLNKRRLWIAFSVVFVDVLL
jgi:hypothetical protein